MKYIMLICLLCLCACSSSWRHSWVILDKKTNECYYLESNNLYIEQKISWYNFNSDWVHTSDKFDLRVVDDSNYDAAAIAMGVKDFKNCRNGLIKSK